MNKSIQKNKSGNKININKKIKYEVAERILNSTPKTLFQWLICSIFLIIFFIILYQMFHSSLFGRTADNFSELNNNKDTDNLSSRTILTKDT
eukprot:UN19490